MKGRLGLKTMRHGVQLFCLLGVLGLFLATEYRGEDTLSLPVSLLFHIDPLAALADALAPGPFSWGLLWPALLLLVFTALLGRFFCGWICPLGTTLDGAHRLLGRRQGRGLARWRRMKYLLFFGLVGAAVAGVQLLGLFDPLSLFLRSLALAIFPAINHLINALFGTAYRLDLDWLNAGADAIYPFLRQHVLAFHQPVFLLALPTLLLFVALLLSERIERRFWCKNLCPLGALLGLCSRWAVLQRVPAQLCPDCQQCKNACKMNAVRGAKTIQAECIRCLDCLTFCPQQRAHFSWPTWQPRQRETDLKRRGVLLALGSGALVAPAVGFSTVTAGENPYLLRPPGAQAEDEFLRRCIRCGQCMKVCIGQTLQPAWLNAGPVGLWSPVVVPRMGYCAYHCTLCGQVCPTGAIQSLSLQLKKETVIGTAVIDQKRCLPYAKDEECLVCEEHCPVADKAILFDSRTIRIEGEQRTVKEPWVVEQRCIGCGICETRCPLEGTSAIRVVNRRESRHA